MIAPQGAFRLRLRSVGQEYDCLFKGGHKKPPVPLLSAAAAISETGYSRRGRITDDEYKNARVS